MAAKTPIRTCIACGAKGDKRSLLRVVRTPQGDIALDEGGRAAGRGAYVCRSAKCFELACKRRLFAARLKTAIQPQELERLQEDFLAAVVKADAQNSRDGE